MISFLAESVVADASGEASSKGTELADGVKEVLRGLVGWCNGLSDEMSELNF